MRNSGEPQRNWDDPDHLPGDTVSYIHTALLAHRKGATFSLDSWE